MITRDQVVAEGKVWTYGYAKNPEFWQDFQQMRFVKFHNGRPAGRIFQYDLEMFCFFNYKKYPTGIPRAEHLWYAIAIRWPETITNGVRTGEFLRNPWAEDIFTAIADTTPAKIGNSENGNIKLMGGGGQGKTKILCCFAVLAFDYFLFTKEGCRVIITSVEENKLLAAAWSHIMSLYLNDIDEDGQERVFSATAGKGKPTKLKIRRPAPFNRDEKGVIVGALLAQGNQKDGGRRLVDKLTGAHVSTCCIIIMDEIQSTPLAPIQAASNAFIRPRHSWFFGSGNPSDMNDAIGQLYEPIGGWDLVNPTKLDNPPVKWNNKNDKGEVSKVLRFDNLLSPGMTNPERYPFLPTQKILEKYKTQEAKNSPDWWRFIRGWFLPQHVQNSCITYSMIIESGADKLPFFANNNGGAIKGRALSFDSAPGSIDESPFLDFRLVQEPDGQYVIHFNSIVSVPKTNKDDFWDTTEEMFWKLTKELRIESGGLISDESGNQTQMRSRLSLKNFYSYGLVYNEKATDKIVNFVTREIAKDVTTNKISEAALLFRNFLIYKQIRGLNEALCDDLQKEICTRKLLEKPSGKLYIEPKSYFNDDEGRNAGFKGRMGFSPDKFDIMCQACWYAREVWGLYPGLNVVNKKVLEDQKRSDNIPRRISILNDRYG